MGRIWPQIADAVDLLRLGAPPWGVSPTTEVALVVDGRLRADAVMLIIKAHLDESDSHKEAPALYLGGYVASALRWTDLDKSWRKMLRKRELNCYHTVDHFSRSGEFRGRSEEWESKLTQRIQELTNRPLFGIAAEVNRADFAEHYVGQTRPKKPRLDTEYGLAFRTVMSFLPAYVQTAMRRADFRIHVILENSQHYGEANRVYEDVRASNARMRDFFAPLLIPGNPIDYPGLQAADSLITSFRRHKNALNLSEPIRGADPRTTFTAARRVRRCPLFHLIVDAESMQRIKSDLIELPERKRLAYLAEKVRREASSSEE